MDILILLQGDPGSGRRTVADIAVGKFNCTGSISINHWCVGVLSNEFKVPLEDFFDSKPFEKPIIVKRSNMSKLLMKIGEYGFNNVNRISTGRWYGYLIMSPQVLLTWFRDMFVTKNCGLGFHLKVTKERFIDKWESRKESEHNAFLITDLNGDITSKDIQSLRPAFIFTVTVSKTPKEATYLLLNDGTLSDLENKVKDMLLSVKEQAKLLIPTTTAK